MVACWTFEQTKGRYAYDISGNNNHARLGKFTGPDDADPKWIDLQAPSPQPDPKTDLQVGSEPISAVWQDIGQAIPPDFNDTMILAEHVNLDSIGQDVEGKVFINLLRDREKTRDQQYRFVLIKTDGTIVEPASYNLFLFGDKLWEKFSFNMPYHRNQIKEFRLQKFPQGLAQKVSLPLAKPYDPHIDGKMIASATSGPPDRGALHFDGKGDYLYVPDSSSLWLGPVFTVEMWIKPEFPKKELENWPSWGLISKGCYTGTGRVKNRGFGVTFHRFSDDPNLLMIDYNTADDNGIYAKSYGRRNFDNWIHLYHVFSSDRYKPGHGYPLVVGKFITPESPFAGWIGEIRIWRGARSREQISEYENKQLTGDELGLAACWTFEQTEGQIAYDISPNRNHARLGKSIEADDADPNWINVTDVDTLYTKPINETYDQVIARSTIEPIGRHALSFDGVDDYLYVAANPTLTLKPPFTIEMWIKPDFSEVERLKTSEKFMSYLSLMRKGERLFQEKKIQAGGFMMFVGPSSQQDGKCYGNLYLGNEDGRLYQVDLSGGERLQSTRPGWLYVSMSCTRETYMPVLYQPLMIGQNIVPSYFPFKGDIAEVRLWSGVRSGDEIARYRNKPLKGNESGLVACWDFKRAEGQIAYDISGNNNHARLGKFSGADDADPKWIDLQAPSPQPSPKTDPQFSKPVKQPETQAVDNRIPLKVDYPEPSSDWYDTYHRIGTKSRGKKLAEKPPLVLVPPDVTNVAKGKPVTSTDAMFILGELEYITDGDKRSKYFVEYEPKELPQHVTIDLERECEIYAVVWWHSFDRAAVYWDVVVQVGKDPKFEDAAILFNNDHDGSLGLGKGTDLNYVETNEGWMAGADGVVGRYIRLYNHTNSNNLINQYTEVEVYGRLPE